MKENRRGYWNNKGFASKENSKVMGIADIYIHICICKI